MRIFKSGDYIVLLSTCNGKNDVWYPKMSVGYCYRLDDDAYSDNRGFNVEKDNRGINNGWNTSNTNYVSHLKMRLAYPNEVEKYKRLGMPFKVSLSEIRRYKLNKLKSININENENI